MNKTHFKIVLLLSLFITKQHHLIGQVGIGTTSPDVSARLDVEADNMGILIPRVELSGTNDVTTIANPATSLLVYNKTAAGSGGNAIQVGFHFWDGTSWQPFTTGAGGGSKWTNDNSNTLVKLSNLSDGSTARTDAQNIYIKDDGNVGVGINNPEEKLDVSGAIQLTYGPSNSQKTIISSSIASGFKVTSHPNYASGKSRIEGNAIGGSGDYYQFKLDDATANQSYPSYSFILDPNTGMTNNSNNRDNLFFTTGGTYRMRINENGNVGIGLGNSAPTSRLDVEGTGLNDGYAFKLSEGVGMYMGNENTVGGVAKGYLNSSAGLGFNAGESLTSGSDPSEMDIYIRNNGFVGIGTTLPNYRFEVNGDTKLDGNAIVSDTLSVGTGPIDVWTWNSNETDLDNLTDNSSFGSIIEGRPSGHFVLGLRDNDADDAFSILSGNGDYISDKTYDLNIATFKANGNVGIGTNTPSLGKTQIEGNAGGVFHSNLALTKEDGTKTSMLNFSVGRAFQTGFPGVDTFAYSTIHVAGAGGAANVGVLGLAYNLVEKYRFANAEAVFQTNLGLGVDNPKEKLHINAGNDSLQIDNLAGTGNLLGIDANGKVTKTTATSVLKVISTSGSHACSPTDEVVILNIDPVTNGGHTTGTVNLNPSPQTGQFITIKKRDATSNPLTINLTGGYTLEDDVTTTITMSVAYQYIKLVFDGDDWVVIGKG